MACTCHCAMQIAVNGRTAGNFLHSDLLKKFKSVFAVTGGL